MKSVKASDLCEHIGNNRDYALDEKYVKIQLEAARLGVAHDEQVITALVRKNIDDD